MAAARLSHIHPFMRISWPTAWRAQPAGLPCTACRTSAWADNLRLQCALQAWSRACCTLWPSAFPFPFGPCATQPLLTWLQPPLLWHTGMVQSVPHALDEHVPALVGPLPVAAAGGGQQRLTQVAGGADVAQALLFSRCGPSCSIVKACKAAGLLAKLRMGMKLLGQSLPALHLLHNLPAASPPAAHRLQVWRGLHGSGCCHRPRLCGPALAGRRGGAGVVRGSTAVCAGGTGD